ncbi:MAG: hypothetical protein JO185_23395 [Acidobacteriaceae bacterium]|nr:hypothetical protein [Acidobacteriaceae bacterium]
MEWIEVSNTPYFQTETGRAWTPIGHNDAITWPSLASCFRRRDLTAVDTYLGTLASCGVTVLRLMLEYCHREHRYFEKPVGEFHPSMVQLWDNLFALCERHGIRILLTPFDTFWMWKRWKRHPYNCANGGPCPGIPEALLHRETREAVKRRLQFVTSRWGGSGTLFAWDIWNEIHPAWARDSSEPMYEFIEDLSTFLRRTEERFYGRSHPQTVSIFGPIICTDTIAAEIVLRHPCLDFASTHFYEEGTIDYPLNTVDAAVSTGAIMRNTLGQVPPSRPFFDSESGPIHTHKDHHRTLPEDFDDEYFRHMQWAHFASGGAGGGMRWPNRKPHTLTRGMHKAQSSLRSFVDLIDWVCFRRVNWNEEAHVSDPSIKLFACGDGEQAIIWLLRSDSIGSDGKLKKDVEAVSPTVSLPCMLAGRYLVTAWDTDCGAKITDFEVQHPRNGPMNLQSPPLVRDLAFAIRRRK